MLFNSFQFAFFLPIVLILFFTFKRNAKIYLLLIASSIFYSYFLPAYLLILIAVILIDYGAGLLIEKSIGRTKKKYLILSLVVNCGILFFFKYFNFVSNNIHELMAFLGWNYSPVLLNFVLPIGLSFHVFQSMSYTLEVYFGREKAEKNLSIYALYVLYFPQLVAGPIERPQNLLEQFKNLAQSRPQLKSGLQLMITGFLKKCVIADNLTITVDQVFSQPQLYSGYSLWIATLFFTFQIFCDFSGYSDIARGCSKLMGVDLMVNFDKPYFSASISEFWRRWHISLSTWFRDYLYIPLGGNQVGQRRKSFNLLLVFLVSGLWHGANWTYVIWGLLHGFYLVIENYLKNLFPNSSPNFFTRFFNILFTFILVFFTWIFFRANHVNDAFLILSRLFKNPLKGWELLNQSMVIEGFVLILLLLIFQLIDNKQNLWQRINSFPFSLRLSIYSLISLFFIIFGQFNHNHFIYFQF
ncbi:MAG: hypothetical protein L6Q37_01040 [Bdellovibrionaceae bacterium]|nr:hypothetical protein [Pseudobdellovibrionaceae bacterium]NUM58388.1 MBOAT family protein [Pseudobdellovibrionaceae bacterium]